MKSIITTITKFTAVCLLMFSCQSDTKTNTKDAGTSDSASTTEATTDAPVHIKSSPSSLMLGMWHFAIVIGKKEEADKYEGRWINIKRDDTFTSGKYLEETNSGTWSFDNDSKFITLKYDKDEGLAKQWATQGGGESIIWKGNAGDNNTGLQIKMVLNMKGKMPGE